MDSVPVVMKSVTKATADVQMIVFPDSHRHYAKPVSSETYRCNSEYKLVFHVHYTLNVNPMLI